MKSRIKILVLFLFVLGAASCKPYTRTEQPYHTNTIPIESGHSIGQTFTARYDGLSGITVYLEPGNSESGSINLHLRKSPQADEEIRFSSLPTKAITTPGYYTFQFPQIEDSSQSTYYLFLKNKGDETVSCGAADYFTYLNGVLYVNHTPTDAQLSFRLVYDLSILALGLFTEGLTWIIWLAAAIFLFVIPGWALLLLMYSDWKRLYWGAKLGLAGGVSLAIYPVLLLWTSLIKLNIGALYAWIPLILGLAFLIWYYRKLILRLPIVFKEIRFSKLIQSPNLYSNLALIILIGLIFGVRFWVVRTLEIPLWGDSYQHTMIVQLLVENGGLFKSWLPYAEIETFTYHFGFHSVAAVFHWITNLPMPQAVLIMGQLLNGFAVIALLPLAWKIKPNRWTGVFVLLIAGLLLHLPMFYVNWGRYTQLAAQAILPAAVFLAWLTLEKTNNSYKLLILSWITWGGLALTHYRVLIFAILILPAVIIFEIRQVGWKQLVLRTFWLGLGAFVIFLPWFIQVFGGKILEIFNYHVSYPANQLPASTQAYNSIGNLTDYLPLFIWLLLPIVLAWGYWRREKKFATISLWSFLVFLAANPNWFNLPGAGTLTNFAVFIAVYIPASLLISAALSWIVEIFSKSISSFAAKKESDLDYTPTISFILFFLVMGLAVYGFAIPLTRH
jgi:hypothetical protein